MTYLGLNTIGVEGSKFETCYGYSEFVSLKINGRKYIPILNALVNSWGVDWKDKTKNKIFSEIKENKDHILIHTKCSDIKVEKYIAGYPSIRLGESIWGPYNGFYLGRPKDYNKMQISTSWAFKTKGMSNLTYDIWITKNKEGGLTNNDLEIMIWLDSNFEPPWDDFGEFEGFKVKYKRKSKDWNGGGHVVAFFPKNKTKSLSFDLKQMIKYCKKKIKSVESYYIRTIELGTEFMKNSEVEAKIKNLEFEFAK